MFGFLRARIGRNALSSLVFLAFVVTGPAALADDDPQKIRAQKLFDEALTLADGQRWSEACPKFRESFAADAAVGALLNVAACSAREGKVLDAAREYRQVLELNALVADTERRKAVEAQVRRALDELAPKLGTVQLEVTPNTVTYRATIDGSIPAPRGAVVEVLAGEHTITIEAEGHHRVHKTIAVSGKQDANIAVALEPIAAPSRPAEPPDQRLSTAGWITGLVGSAGLATGVVLLTMAADRAAAIRDECGPDVEPPSCPLGDSAHANDLASEGQSFAAGAYVGLSVGGALLATGVSLLVADAVATKAETPRVSVAASSEGAMLVVGGRFR